MSLSTPSQVLRSKILSKASRPDEFSLYKAALEWDLVDPIVIQGREDIKSEQRWKDRVEPYHHQVQNLITYCRRLPVTLLADDVGLGKTISAGLIVSELIARGHLTRILIVCPKMLGEQWKEELDTKFGIAAEVATGRDLIDAEPEGTSAVITTYDSARMHLTKVPKDRFQMLILDEAHKLRNLHGTESPPKVAVEFRKVLEERRFRYVLMLTATPIQNRLWDIYSLVDLLTVARGHENPFGSPGLFARRFIADDRETARVLKPEAKSNFRDIVYNYMSRMRRGDANLSFPERVVQLEKVDPTPEEWELVKVVNKNIQGLNALAQISVLFALTSSPQALRAQLDNMARNGTIRPEFAAEVRTIVEPMKSSAKLTGLVSLIARLAVEKPGWRAVVFTKRLETQTTIQLFLEEIGIPVGIINGSSGHRNQETIRKFREENPPFRVIVATEAGSEGLNLQVANVLVNYDLPWNPMIVEQRIGRVQRLASQHRYVSILNMTLAGTFEEFIVARLMEKLQLASHAIGDIEAILEASGMDEDDSDIRDSSGQVRGFEEQIRRLVLAALKGQDINEARDRALISIDKAKEELSREEENINNLLGGMGGGDVYVGPKAPKLPPLQRSMEPSEFVKTALLSEGFELAADAGDKIIARKGDYQESISFDPNDTIPGTVLYAPGSPAFSQLVDRVVASGIHEVEDIDRLVKLAVEQIAQNWVHNFGGNAKVADIAECRRHFGGTATVRARVTVAHDSYERLVDVVCSRPDHASPATAQAVNALPAMIEDATVCGVSAEKLLEATLADDAVSEFRRFYLERREGEVRAAGEDERKRAKLFDDFTPRMEATLVALSGEVHRDVDMRVSYCIEGSQEYESLLRVTPSTGEIVSPPMGSCEETGRVVPTGCLSRCQMTGLRALDHLLVRSGISQRRALRAQTFTSELTGVRILADEAEISDVTNKVAARGELIVSSLSGRRGEPQYLARCEFTGAEALNDELSISQVSGRLYRTDQSASSVFSGITGHVSEFRRCQETGAILLLSEGSHCEATGKFVQPHILEVCAFTRKRVLASELGVCAYSGTRILRRLIVHSSVSGVAIAEHFAVRSVSGVFCTPKEVQTCAWSGRRAHPEDLRICGLTGVLVHVDYTNGDSTPKLDPLHGLLIGKYRRTDAETSWNDLEQKVSASLGGAKCAVEAAYLAPGNGQIAVCCEVRTLFGFKVNHAGVLFSLDDGQLLGHIAMGKRSPTGWSRTQS